MIFGRKKREIKEHVEGYREGRRLMRHGDGADEWIGMDLTRKHLLALVDLGCDETGSKVDVKRQAEVLRLHGLRKNADVLEQAERFKRWV
jgi:hypothetical protein